MMQHCWKKTVNIRKKHNSPLLTVIALATDHLVNDMSDVNDMSFSHVTSITYHFVDIILYL